jgi:hypothetical protein
MIKIISIAIISIAVIIVLIAASYFRINIQSEAQSNSNPDSSLRSRTSFSSIPQSIQTKLSPQVMPAQLYVANLFTCPLKFFHGTTRQNALKIYSTGLWLIGESKPSAIWMTSNIEKAKIYAGSKGYIVVVNIDPALNLKKLRDEVFIFEVPDAKPNEEYLAIEGLKPSGIIDVNGKKIR